MSEAGLTVAIIPARSGSKGIPRKNLAPLCGRPLIAWSIRQALAAECVDRVYVSSDSDEILAVAEAEGALPIRRPDAISGDRASSESAWLHTLDEIEAGGDGVALTVAMQATSPIREAGDLDAAIRRYRAESYDSLLSVCEVEDFFTWKLEADGSAQSVNYDWRARKPRQLIEKRYLENGSFYLFPPRLLREGGNRLGGRIGLHVMARHKMFQVDNAEDLTLVAAILRGYGLDRL